MVWRALAFQGFRRSGFQEFGSWVTGYELGVSRLFTLGPTKAADVKRQLAQRPLLWMRAIGLKALSCKPRKSSAQEQERKYLIRGVWFKRTPHPVIVTILDNTDYIRVLLYSYYATITGWGAF